MSLNQLFLNAGLPDLVTVAELATAMRMTPQAIRKNLKLQGHHHGLIPLSLGRSIRFRLADVQHLLLNGSAK